MEKEIVYKRSRRDIIMYLLLVIIADLGCAYMILCNSYILGGSMCNYIWDCNTISYQIISFA